MIDLSGESELQLEFNQAHTVGLRSWKSKKKKFFQLQNEKRSLLDVG